MSLEKALGEVLVSLFTQRELEHFLEDGPKGDEVIGAMPPGLPRVTTAREVVKILVRFGQLDEAFFEQLLSERPGREDDIQAARRLWILETTSMQVQERVTKAGDQVESQVSAAVALARTHSDRAKRISLWALGSSLLVVAVAVAVVVGLNLTRSDLIRVRKQVAAQASEVQDLLDQLDEVREIATASNRLLDSPGVAAEESDLEDRRSREPDLFQQENENRPSMAGKLWPVGKTLKVRFLDGTPSQHEQVKHWAPIWLDSANLAFDFSGSPDADIRISFQPGQGSWAYVGTDALGTPDDAPTMNLGWLEKGNLLHEFGHVLGFIHEHQNPYANIDWDETVVLADLSGPPNSWDAASIHSRVLDSVSPELYANYRTFDPESIMMYSFPAHWTVDGQGFVGNKADLSASDRDFARRLYPSST